MADGDRIIDKNQAGKGTGSVEGFVYCSGGEIRDGLLRR